MCIRDSSCTHPYLTKIDPNKLKEELEKSKKVLEDKGFEVDSFASPYGNFDENVISATKDFYKSQRGTESHPGRELRESLNDLNVDPYKISAIQIRHEYDFNKLKNVVDITAKEKKWAVFYLHSLTAGSSSDYQYEVKELDKFLSYLSSMQKQGKIKVTTISEWIESRK
jgi:peptidoglycan/xylan/chitin deacetylase (PgdA/CDA1 family)